MDSKNSAEVLIDGHIYTLVGAEEKSYFQKVAGYINEKTSKMREQPGFGKQSADYQTVMVELNMADDYFKALERIEGMERQKNDMEREIYSLKHELVSTQMKLEAALRSLEVIQEKQFGAAALKEEKEDPAGASEAAEAAAAAEEPAAERDAGSGLPEEAGGEISPAPEAEQPAPAAPVRPSQKGGHGIRRGGRR